MNRALQLALGLFVVLCVAGAVNAALITATPEHLRSPWIVLSSTGALLLVAGVVWWRTFVRRRS